MSKMQRQFQQGDVLIVSSQIPSSAKRVPKDGNRYIIARGETTGHAHVVEACPEVELFEDHGVLYLAAAKPTTITHEEHKPVTVPPGTYELGIVQEYDYDAAERKSVRD